jgi:malate/lactate dehydrogenase
MVPMLTNTLIKEKKATDILDHKWIDTFFNPKVGKRGAEIIEARKLSSAASAANGAIDHIENWVNGSDGWTSMCIHSDGSYGVPKDLIYSFPVVCKGGKYEIVKGI